MSSSCSVLRLVVRTSQCSISHEAGELEHNVALQLNIILIINWLFPRPIRAGYLTNVLVIIVDHYRYLYHSFDDGFVRYSVWRLTELFFDKEPKKCEKCSSQFPRAQKWRILLSSWNQKTFDIFTGKIAENNWSNLIVGTNFLGWFTGLLVAALTQRTCSYSIYTCM